MSIDIKFIEQLTKTCRKCGIKTFKGFDIEFTLDELPQKQSRRRSDQTVNDPTDPYENFPDVELTPEQLMYYSSGGLPENDPHLKDKQ